MAGRTTRFGFNDFGSGVDGAITDDGGKFAGFDRIAIDRILAAYELHTHDGGDQVSNPSEAPGASLDSTSGNLPAGQTYYYRVGFVDQYGLETAGSTEAAVNTPATLVAPTAPALAGVAMPDGDTSGNTGLIADVTYYYALTAAASGGQTPIGSAAILTASSDLPAVDITFPDVQDGQDTWYIWRRSQLQTQWVLIGTVSDTTVTDFIDDGILIDVAPNSAVQPPTTNFTNSSNSVLVTAPDDELVGDPTSGIRSWRIYRSTQSGVYAPVSLVTEVVATVNPDGSGGLVTTFVDSGDAPLQAGQPLQVSQALIPSQSVAFPVVATYTDLPDPTSLGDGNVTLVEANLGLYGVLNHSWRQLSGGSADPGGPANVMLSPGGWRYGLVVYDDAGTLATELLDPTAPTSFTVMAPSAAHVTATWAAPTSNGITTTLSGYYAELVDTTTGDPIEGTDSNVIVPQTVSSTTTTVTFLHVPAGTWRVNVQAIGNDGYKGQRATGTVTAT